MIVKHRTLLPLAVFSVALAARSDAEEPPAPPADCSAPEYRALDFKLGSFVVTGGGGQPAGESTVESVLGGCLLVEHWKGALGGYGRATMFYDRREGLWHKVFVTDDGETMYLTGTRQGDSVVFLGANDFDVFTGVHRMTWSPLPAGGVRQVWELSTDGGATWKLVHEGLYARRP